MTISQFSEDQLAGQRLMAGFDGLEMTPRLEYLIDTLKVGGVILFSRNISGPPQLKSLCSQIQTHAKNAGQPPLLISVDQEGGIVARLQKPFTIFEGNPSMKDVADAEHFARVTARELCSVGIGMNMAPVLDVASEGFESVMEGRMFGTDPQRTARLGLTVIRTFQNNGIMAVGKHFPGIGRTTLDSHKDLPVLKTDLDELESFELIPFRSAIAHGVAGIMLSHIRYEGVDPQWPASISKIIAKKLLRQQMGFQGVVITDDLDMGAMEKHFDIETIISRIGEADIDIALICHESSKIDRAFEIMKEKITQDEKAREKALKSVERIISLKEAYR